MTSKRISAIDESPAHWLEMRSDLHLVRVPRIFCRFLLSPAKRYPVENWLREIVALCYYSLRKKKILGSRAICIRIRHSGRVCFVILLLGRDEADSFDLRGGTIRAIYMGKNKTRRSYIRRILIVLNNTRTSQYKRHIQATKIRRDQESWRDLAKIALSKNRCQGLSLDKTLLILCQTKCAVYTVKFASYFGRVLFFLV